MNPGTKAYLFIKLLGIYSVRPRFYLQNYWSFAAYFDGFLRVYSRLDFEYLTIIFITYLQRINICSWIFRVKDAIVSNLEQSDMLFNIFFLKLTKVFHCDGKLQKCFSYSSMEIINVKHFSKSLQFICL